MTNGSISDAGNYNFQVFTLPGESYVVAYGINDLGEVTGVSDINGFIDNAGSITPVNVPESYPVPLAINNLGQVVGEFPKSDGENAFLDTNGTITYFSQQAALGENGEATGINDFGQVVGQFTETSGITPVAITPRFGFIDTNGTLTNLTLTDGTAFLPTGINDFDQIAGTTTAGASGVLDLKTGQFTAIEAPGAKSTDATAINNFGQVAGTYIDSSGSIHAFVDTHGHFEFLQLPASLSGTVEAVTAINDLGQVVGQLVGSNGVTESFIATPHDLSQPVKGGVFDLWQNANSCQTGSVWHFNVNAGSVHGPLNLGHG